MLASRFQAHRRLAAFDVLAAYSVLLSALALAVASTTVMIAPPLDAHADAWPIILFAMLALLAERESIPVSASTEASVAALPLVFAAVVFGPIGAIVVGGVAMLSEFPWTRFVRRAEHGLERPYLRFVVWTSSRVLVAAVGGVVAWGLLGEPTAGSIVAATAAALCAITVADLTLTGLTLRIRGTDKTLRTIVSVGKISAASVPIYGAVAALLVYAYLEITPLTAALFIVPAVAFQRLLAVTRKQQEALSSLASVNERLERANLSFATALVATLDARDRYTAGHSEAVAMYARDIAAEFGWSQAQQQLVDLCGLVHDIGKIGLPAGLLEKPGALTPDERLQMEEHSAIGERILANVEDYAEIAVIVRHHHERWDGAGYPDGVAGTDIPMISRVLAVADAYDAMTSDRPYRAALPSREARRRLRDGAGVQFDADVVAAFEAVLAKAPPEYLEGRSASQDDGVAQREPVVALAS
jgi:putative nucleotidyltransferase with HDIG domain